jgi:hypothetical protein
MNRKSQTQNQTERDAATIWATGKVHRLSMAGGQATALESMVTQTYFVAFSLSNGPQLYLPVRGRYWDLQLKLSEINTSLTLSKNAEHRSPSDIALLIANHVEESERALHLQRVRDSGKTDAKKQQPRGVVGIREANDVKAVIAKAVEGVKDDYRSCREVLFSLHEASRHAFAVALKSPLNAAAAKMPQSTYEEKKTLAKWVNAELRHLGLALRDPKTGKPCFLIGNAGNRPGSSRFLLDYVDDKGKRVRAHTSVTLPELELMPDDLSKAQYGERTQRSR